MKDWKTIPRRGYVKEATPLERAIRFSEQLGTRVRIKRDDLLPYGGNKLRKLDYLMEEAVHLGADTLITASTNQCCHNSMLALLANREGMRCRLIMESWGDARYRYETASNHEMLRLCGVDEVAVTTDLPTGPVEGMPLAQRMAQEVRTAGGRPYFMSRGGAGALGAVGYVRCAAEIVTQCGSDLPDVVVCPCGIGGTQAGLTVGFHVLGCDMPVIGVGVTGKSEVEMEASVANQCRELTNFLGIDPLPMGRVRCLDGYAGAGYSKPSREQMEVMGVLAKTEGILTDPVYSGKTLFGLVGLAQQNTYSGRGLLFLHTGGLQLFYDFKSMIEVEESE